jgi:hypothetical protein
MLRASQPNPERAMTHCQVTTSTKRPISEFMARSEHDAIRTASLILTPTRRVFFGGVEITAKRRK